MIRLKGPRNKSKLKVLSGERFACVFRQLKFKTNSNFKHFHFYFSVFAQPELFESLSMIEPHCDEMCKKKFAKLFDMQPKQTKKKKLDKDT
jgi:hypothetical protein